MRRYCNGVVVRINDKLYLGYYHSTFSQYYLHTWQWQSTCLMFESQWSLFSTLRFILPHFRVIGFSSPV